MQLTKTGAFHIARLTQLEWLETAGGVLCDQGVHELRVLTSLTYLSIAQVCSSPVVPSCPLLLNMRVW